MRQLLTAGLVVLAALAVAAAPVFAGNCASSDKGSAGNTCCAGQAKSASGRVCTPDEQAACAVKLGVPLEKCAELCKSGKVQKVDMLIKGMEGGTCEPVITAGLEKVDGVIRVCSISSENGCVSMCVDPSKVQTATLVEAVAKQGYQAQIVPAVATSTTVEAVKTAGAGDKAVCPMSKAACPSTCSAKAKDAKEVKKDKGDDSR
ncbi:MAG TPA: heavy-metal-associated domain-containing protein [Acidobacteriota bacterium]|nr:heavy-metal-associated domain-containing protein [Acidobacteriota bacterium]